MSQHSAFERFLVDIGHGAILEEVEAIHIFWIVVDIKLLLRLVNQHDRFKHDTAAVLNVLAHGVQVGGENNRCRENSLLIFTFALAEQLLPPFVHHCKRRLVTDEHFNRFALAVQNIADCGIAVAGVFGKVGIVELILSLRRALHQFIDIGAGNRDRQQAHGGEHGIAAADVIRNHKGFITFAIGKLFERSFRAVGRAVNTAAGFFLAVFLFQIIAQHTERDGRLRGGARFGNHVDGYILAVADIQQLAKRGGTDAVAGKIDVRRVLVHRIVQRGF